MTIVDLPKLSRRYWRTAHRYSWQLDLYLWTAPSKRFISWVFLTVPHLFIRSCNNPAEITRNYFCGVFLKNHKYLWEMFLRRLRDVTEKKSFSRHARDVLKTSHKRHLFWDAFETSLRHHTKFISFGMFLSGLWDVSLNGDLIEISQRHLMTAETILLVKTRKTFVIW